MDRVRNLVSGIAIGAMLLGSGLTAAAQSTPASDDVDVRARLAAVTPGASDLPTGYEFVGETFLDIDQVAASGIDAGALQSSGFVTQYVSVYENPDSNERVRSYVSIWEDDAAAEQGFEVMEDEAETNPGDALEDSDTEVGEEPRETTTGTYTLDDGTTISTVDITFRRGPMVVGVAHERMDGEAADPDIAADIAARADERAQAVLNGESPQHTDLSLPSMALSFDADANALAQAGFLGPVEVESIYGVQGSLLSNVDASWVETTMIGSASVDAPTVTLGVTSFGSEQDAQFTAEQATDIFMPLGNQEEVDGASIDGASAVSAFRYSSEGSDGLDSYRLIFSEGDMLTVIDVQGAATDSGAEEAANAIAEAQLSCQSEGVCEVPVLPGSFTGQ